MRLARVVLLLASAAACFVVSADSPVTAMTQYCSWDAVCTDWHPEGCLEQSWVQTCYWGNDPEGGGGGGGGGGDDPVSIRVEEAAITENRVVVKTRPLSLSGRLEVVVVRSSGDTVLLDDTRSGGDHTLSFQIGSLANGEYSAVIAKWHVGTGPAILGSYPVAFYMLGQDVEHTQYNIPSESACTSGHVDREISVSASQCTTIINATLRYDFTRAVDLNGTGRSQYYGPLHTSVNATCEGKSHYTKISTITGSHGEVNNETVAKKPNHPHVAWGGKIFLFGAPTSIKTATDTCYACNETHFDNFNSTNAHCSPGAVGDYGLGEYPTISLRQ